MSRSRGAPPSRTLVTLGAPLGVALLAAACSDRAPTVPAVEPRTFVAAPALVTAVSDAADISAVLVTTALVRQQIDSASRGGR